MGELLFSNNQTNWSNQLEYKFPPVEFHHRVFTVWLALVAVFGFTANTLIVYLTRTESGHVGSTNETVNRKALIHFFVYNLAKSDVGGSVVAGLSTLEYYVEILDRDWSCWLSRFFTFSFGVITIYAILIIAIERYLQVVHPFQAPKPSTTVKMIHAAWVAGTLLSIIGASCYKTHRRFHDDGVTYSFGCGPAKDLPQGAMFMGFLFFCYITPGSTIIFTIIHTLLVLRKMIPGDSNLQQHVHKRRATKMMITIIFAFLLPYTGYFAYNVIFRFTSSPFSYKTEYILRYGLGHLCLSNVCVNPVIYMYQMRSLRTKLKYIVKGQTVTPA